MAIITSKPKRLASPGNRFPAAFTLIELLVVIAIIAVLMAILMPSLQLVKRKAAAAVCLSNTKNLSLGWFMYQQENDGKIMSSRMGTPKMSTDGPWIRRPIDVAGNEMSITQTSPPVEDEDEIRGIKLGYLWPYVKGPDVYHCPADNIRKSVYDGTRVFVSYSVAKNLNGWPKGQTNLGRQYQIRKFGEIRSPSSKYVFVETAGERNWGWQGSFSFGHPKLTLAVKGVEEPAWHGPLAINHGDSSILGYTDGHSVVRKWRDKFTRERVDKLFRSAGSDYGIDLTPADQKNDVNFMNSGWPMAACP